MLSGLSVLSSQESFEKGAVNSGPVFSLALLTSEFSGPLPCLGATVSGVSVWYPGPASDREVPIRGPRHPIYAQCKRAQGIADSGIIISLSLNVIVTFVKCGYLRVIEIEHPEDIRVYYKQYFLKSCL